jgi:predicted RNase H-like HicB family nuclease
LRIGKKVGNGRNLRLFYLKNPGPRGRRLMRQALIYPGEDGFWVAECPSLPGCVSQGKTKEEAISNIREAIGGYIKALEEDGLPVPL